MEQPHEYIKHLLYTVWVVSSVYYTEIFSIELWKSTLAKTFVELIKRKVAEDILPQILSFIESVARAVDALELTLCRDHLQCQGMGLESVPPETDLLGLRADVVTKYFITQLLDRLVWAYSTSKPLPKCLVAHKHPLDISKANIKPLMCPELNNYVNFTTIQIVWLLSWFKSNQLLSAGSGVTWSNDPQASLRDVSAPEDAATEFSPSKREHLVQHIHAFSESSKFHGVSNIFKLSSNSPTYFQDLIASLDHIQMEPEHKSHISHIFNQFKGQRRPIQIALILAALLGERSLNSVSIMGTQAIMSALLPPLVTHLIHLSMEWEIWKLLPRFVGTLSFQPMNATSQTSSLDLERFFVLDDTQVLEDNEVSFLKTPFEHGVDLKWKPVIPASSQGGEEQLDPEAGPSNQGVGVGLSEKNAEALPSIDNQGGQPK
ncbi:hypothetical protein K439DRAFT_1625212 [Ramaria rubella]|nr:hypothetical protein K439DRAFT_1625212 [Ramaria rubella]